jgi:hypothetical protein
MLKSRLTFKEAIESPDHSLMSRHRLKVAQREFYSRTPLLPRFVVVLRCALLASDRLLYRRTSSSISWSTVRGPASYGTGSASSERYPPVYDRAVFIGLEHYPDNVTGTRQPANRRVARIRKVTHRPRCVKVMQKSGRFKLNV